MSLPLLEALGRLGSQMDERRDLVSKAIGAASVGLCRDAASLVAEYACEGFFATRAKDLPDLFLTDGEGHHWSATSFSDETGGSPATIRVDSTRFTGSVYLGSGDEHLESLASLPDGSLLVVTYCAGWLSCSSVGTDGVVRELWCNVRAKWTQRDEAFVMACCVDSEFASAEVEFFLPGEHELLVFDAFTGAELRKHRLKDLDDYTVVPAGNDLLVCCGTKRVRIFSRKAGQYVAQWNQPMGDVDYEPKVSRCGQVVQLFYFRQGVALSCELRTGRVLHSMDFKRVKSTPWAVHDCSPGGAANFQALGHQLYAISF